MIGPILDEIEKENTDIIVGKVNVDNDPNLAREFNVVSIPHLVVIKNGEKVNEAIGYQSKEELLKLVN